MDKSQNEIDIFFNNLLTSLQRADSTFARLKYLGDYCNGYLNNSVTKTMVARLAITEETLISVRDLKAFIASLASYSSDIDGKLSTLYHAVADLWRNVLDEYTLYPFYEKIHEDIQALEQGSAESTEIISAFAHMLDTNKTFVRENVNKLPYIMNTDLLNVSSSDKTDELSDEFTALRKLFQAETAYDEQEEFFDSFENLQSTLQTFIEKSKIDTTFFR